MKIYIDRLHDHEHFEATLPPAFLDLHEKDIATPAPVIVQGEASIVDDLLMLTLSVKTEIEMPCSICNAVTRVPLENKNILISIPLSEISSAVFDCTDAVREEVVMLIPPFVECKQGACPQRDTLRPFLKKETQNFPFADLH